MKQQGQFQGRPPCKPASQQASTVDVAEWVQELRLPQQVIYGGCVGGRWLWFMTLQGPTFVYSGGVRIRTYLYLVRKLAKQLTALRMNPKIGLKSYH
jgi:hypothetical protein